MNQHLLPEADIARLLRGIERGNSVSEERRQLRRAQILEAFDERSGSAAQPERSAPILESNERSPRGWTMALIAAAAATIFVTASLLVVSNRDAEAPAASSTPPIQSTSTVPRARTLQSGLRFTAPDGMFVARVGERSALLAPIDEPIDDDNRLVIADVGAFDIDARLEALEAAGDVIPLRSSIDVGGTLLRRWEVSVTQAGAARHQCDADDSCLQLAEDIDWFALPSSGRRIVVGINLVEDRNVVVVAPADASASSLIADLLGSVRFQR